MGINIFKRGRKSIDYLFIVIGTLFMAVGVNMIYEPMQMVTGGVSGLAIVIKEWTGGLYEGGIPIWLTNAACNIPLFLVALRIKGKKFIWKTLSATLCFTLFLYLIPEYHIVGSDYLMAAICGGTISGAGLGLVFLTSTSTGGSDLFGTILHAKMKSISIPRLLLGIDTVIVLIGAGAFGLRSALYAVIAVYITSHVMDAILEGIKFAKLVYIISENYEEIAETVLKRMERGVTSISVKGMYQNSDRKMLMCVVSKKEVVKLVDLATVIDRNVFMIVSDIREVRGEGFIEYRQDSL